MPESSKKNFRQRRMSSSSSESDTDETDSKDETVKLSKREKIEELKFIQKQRQRTHGIDVYSLAIGEQDTTISTKDQIENDPWKKKTGGLVDLKLLKEKRGNEIVKNMNSNFARETNQRDEDAEMQKFIEEQLQLKKLAEKGNDASSENQANKFKRPEDALFDVPKFLIENTSKFKSEESISEQMLSGIPEVDLGMEERIRNIEDTEKAKQKVIQNRSVAPSLVTTPTGKYRVNPNEMHSQYAPHNTSVNFVQHKRFDDALINPDHMIKPRLNRPNTNQTKTDQPVVGDAPKHELLQQASKTISYMNSDRFKKHANAKPLNPNARRQYHVSTNMNEEPQIEAIEAVLAGEAAPESESMPIPVSSSHNPSSESSKPHKKTHKRHHNDNQAEKASDEYCLERFKKNMRFNRKSKIKIA